MKNSEKLAQELQKEQFKKDLHHSGEVSRSSVADKAAVSRANEGLKGIGQFIQEEEPSLKEATYLGSAAVHYFHFPSIGQPVFVSQASPIGDTPEALVQEGITDLRNELMRQYGRSPQRKRSGF